MNQSAIPRHDTLHAAIGMTEGICRLPAVATLDWLDRAAATFLPIASPSRVCILIVQSNENGRGVSLEAAGYAGLNRQTRGSIDGQDEGGIELSIRSRAERLEELGFPRPTGPMLGSMANLIEGGDWRTRGLGLLWQGIPASEILLVAHPLGSVEAGRCLITMVGLAEPGAEAKPGQIELLGALHPMLVRRALVAIGPTRATSSRWLTAREQEVLDLLVVGKSVRVIAEELQRSPHTVHDHVKSLHRKLGASSRGELVARALGHTPLTAQPAAATREEGPAEVRTTSAASRLQPATGASAEMRPAESRHIEPARN